jgi:hypothetical protein
MIQADAEVNLENMAILLRAIDEGFAEGLDQVGKHIVNLASQLAPEDTGELKGSGDYQVIDKTLDVSFGNGLPDDRAIAQEYGTIYMPAQPYLSVAVANIDVLEEIASAIRRRLV